MRTSPNDWHALWGGIIFYLKSIFYILLQFFYIRAAICVNIVSLVSTCILKEKTQVKVED